MKTFDINKPKDQIRNSPGDQLFSGNESKDAMDWTFGNSTFNSTPTDGQNSCYSVEVAHMHTIMHPRKVLLSSNILK